MSYNNSAQGSEAPFNLSDYVTFDFDFEVPETSQAMSIDNPFDANYAETFDTVLNGTSQHATQAASVDFSMMDALPTTAETDTLPEDFTVFEPMALVTDVDADALHNPGSLPSSPPSWVPPTLNFQPEPSRWVPVSPELQRQLNTTYAPQLDLLACDPNPAPVFFLAAEDQMVSPAGSAASHPSGDLTGYELPQTSEPRVGTASINPALLMRESIDLSPRRLPSYDAPSPFSSVTEHGGPRSAALSSITTTKRAFETDESESEPRPKRIRTAGAESRVNVVKDEDFDDGEGSNEMRVSLSQPDLLPVVVKDHEPEPTTEAQSQDELENTQKDDSNKDIRSSDSSPPPPTLIPPPNPVARKAPSTPKSSNSSSKKSAHWRYEQANETDLRNQRRKQWSDRLRNDSTTAKGKTPSRKMQKLLEEIEDSQEFVEAQGCKAGEGVGGNSGAGRPVRSGARKSYVGQG